MLILLQGYSIIVPLWYNTTLYLTLAFQVGTCNFSKVKSLEFGGTFWKKKKNFCDLSSTFHSYWYFCLPFIALIHFKRKYFLLFFFCTFFLKFFDLYTSNKLKLKIFRILALLFYHGHPFLGYIGKTWIL